MDTGVTKAKYAGVMPDATSEVLLGLVARLYNIIEVMRSHERYLEAKISDLNKTIASEENLTNCVVTKLRHAEQKIQVLQGKYSEENPKV
jgi:hypothetical protein